MKIKWVLLIAILLPVVALASCQKSKDLNNTYTKDDLLAIELATKQYRDAEAVNDWETVTMLYTEDAIRMLPKGPTIQGRDEILNEFESRPSIITEYDQQIVEVEGFGDVAIVRGVFSYTAEANDKSFSGTGKYIAIYKRQKGGGWLISRDIFNFDSSP